VIVPGVSLVAPEGIPHGRRARQFAQEPLPEGACSLGPDEDVAAVESLLEGRRLRVLELGHGTLQPRFEEALGQGQARDPQLLGDVDFILGDRPLDVRLAREIEIPVLQPLPVDALPVVRVAVELAVHDDRRGRRGGGCGEGEFVQVFARGGGQVEDEDDEDEDDEDELDHGFHGLEDSFPTSRISPRCGSISPRCRC
jgi:hypothetical protein